MSAFAPLSGMTVLDLTRNVAGPFATLILADLGARVIKVEHPDQGDDTRRWGPPFVQDDGAMFLQLNRNKESITLNLGHPAARELLTDLVRDSDVLVESFRTGSLDRMGFGPGWAQSINPRLIYASITAYGDAGPMRDLPGYDPLMQAYGGLMSVTGEPHSSPVRVGFSVVDMGTGMWCAIGVLAALARVRETGHGEHIVTALFETSIAWAMMMVGNYWASGEVPHGYGSGTSTIVPYRAYRARDGHVVIAAGNDRLFARLCELFGHAEWARESGFSTNPERVTNRDAVDARIGALVAEWEVHPLLEALMRAGIPCSEVRSLDQVARDPQAAALGIFTRAAHGSFTDQPIVALPLTGGGERPPIMATAPKLGEHNEFVLQRLGCDAATLQRYRQAMCR
jgi:crotonobetainyl-CoA:carnitine CoA-transferase CaiB-like acyl-CoA transferase